MFAIANVDAAEDLKELLELLKKRKWKNIKKLLKKSEVMIQM